MNREHWKAVLPFVQAFADGKPVETATGAGGWISKDDMLFVRDASNYRIGEPQKLRPWNRKEVPHDAWFRSKTEPNEWFKVVSIDSMHITSIGCKWSFNGLFNKCEHSTDGGKTWHPCGVVEGGAA